ncbi:homeobox protein AKR isoform X2 [Dendroctonus ponderosae]
MFSSGSVWSVTCENRVRNPEDVTLHAQNMNIPLNQHFARRRRGNLPKDSVRVLKSWLYSNRYHPYPTETEKGNLAKKTNLASGQVCNWFINARRRELVKIIKNEGRDPEDYKISRRGKKLSEDTMQGIHACNSENCIKITAEMDHDYEKGPNIKNAILMKLDGKDELNEFDILVNTAVMLRDMERKDD